MQKLSNKCTLFREQEFSFLQITRKPHEKNKIYKYSVLSLYSFVKRHFVEFMHILINCLDTDLLFLLMWKRNPQTVVTHLLTYSFFLFHITCSFIQLKVCRVLIYTPIIESQCSLITGTIRVKQKPIFSSVFDDSQFSAAGSVTWKHTDSDELT